MILGQTIIPPKELSSLVKHDTEQDPLFLYTQSKDYLEHPKYVFSVLLLGPLELD